MNMWTKLIKGIISPKLKNKVRKSVKRIMFGWMVGWLDVEWLEMVFYHFFVYLTAKGGEISSYHSPLSTNKTRTF